MAVLLEVEEIAVGDYSEEYGTVTVVEETADAIRLEFINGKSVSFPKGAELMILQGGRFDHDKKRRPFLNR
jgi:hypothetical protein